MVTISGVSDCKPLLFVDSVSGVTRGPYTRSSSATSITRLPAPFTDTESLPDLRYLWIVALETPASIAAWEILSFAISPHCIGGVTIYTGRHRRIQCHGDSIAANFFCTYEGEGVAKARH